MVKRLTTNLLGAPLLVHSTSWRRARNSVILSFIAIIADKQAPLIQGVRIARAELARSGPTEASRSIAATQVIEHGLRHLSWLAQDDAVVQSVLSPDWKRVLADYAPEPFQHL